MDETQEFQQQLERRIANYHDMRSRSRKRLTELNHELNSLERRLEAAEELYRREFGAEPPGTEAPRRQRTRAASTNGDSPSWSEAILSVLNAEGRPLHVRAIWERLLAEGFQTESRDPIRSIVSIAVRHPQIERVAPNTYRLTGAETRGPQLPLLENDVDLPGTKGSA